MISFLLAAVQAAAPVPATAIDAERAFVADAQKLGQWTAFRKWSAPDAVTFAPQPVNAHQALADAKDPPHAIYWWPGRSYVSCDGKLAVNTGPWVNGFGKHVGYFTTVWMKQPDGGWKWIYDGGDELKFARDEGGDIKPVIASCGAAPKPPVMPARPAGFRNPLKTGNGQSADGTLVWQWNVDAAGARHFVTMLWDGKAWQPVIDDRVAAPPPPPR
ncbi:hypothetical protein [Sphingomonas sp. HDW15A]|uniref:hypothetical protein n=1 Tax=Sphingomonas sp. HDW15A TaxID=2714942 RepID=UPI001F0D23D0|nr:hypothetical protein [Sphingomonas sp. HDW15A]